MVVSLCACTVAPSPTAPSATTTVDAMSALEGFEPAFFRALLQNGYEAPHLLEPIRMLRGPLRIYLRTRDESGRAVDRLTLDMTERTLIDSAWIWSGRWSPAAAKRPTARRRCARRRCGGSGSRQPSPRRSPSG